MKTFRHDINERNKSNVIKLRMKYGAAGYGIYMMLLERLAMEPTLRSELDYDMLAYEFHESAELIRHVIEDFDLFIIDLDSETFSNEELDRQLFTKSKRAQQEKILDEYIEYIAANSIWLEQIAKKYETSPERIRALVRTGFRDKILAGYTFIPKTRVLSSIMDAMIDEAFRFTS